MQILNREHEFCGFTGRVLHVDSRDPGREVAEVGRDIISRGGKLRRVDCR